VIVVLDASVVLKWLLEDPAREPDTEKALAVIESVVRGGLEILQPVHWLAEVAAISIPYKNSLSTLSLGSLV